MRAPTFKAVIYDRFRRCDGSYLVRVRITKNGVSRYLRTTIEARPDQLTAKLKPKDPRLLRRIEALVVQMREAVADIDPFVLDALGVDDVVNIVCRSGDKSQGFRLDFPDYFAQVASRKGSGKKNYMSALRSFSAFMGREHYDISEITSPVLMRYRLQLERRYGEGARCVSLYLSSIAHVVGCARSEHNDPEHGVVLVGDPFSHFNMPRQEPAQRRNVPPALIGLMLYFRSSLEGRERLGVDVFLISFAMMGMNAPDLFSARAAQGGVVTYERAKTRDRRSDRALMKVRMEPAAAFLFDEYAGRDGWLFSFRERYSRSENFSRAVNLGLAQFSARLRLRLPYALTLYCARHTWGTVARSAMCRIDKSVVHEALCHVDGSMRVTDIYAEKDWSVIWDANARVVGLFFP